jgi:hypothetical protein
VKAVRIHVISLGNKSLLVAFAACDGYYMGEINEVYKFVLYNRKQEMNKLVIQKLVI